MIDQDGDLVSLHRDNMSSRWEKSVIHSEMGLPVPERTVPVPTITEKMQIYQTQQPKNEKRMARRKDSSQQALLVAQGMGGNPLGKSIHTNEMNMTQQYEAASQNSLFEDSVAMTLGELEAQIKAELNSKKGEDFFESTSVLRKQDSCVPLLR